MCAPRGVHGSWAVASTRKRLAYVLQCTKKQCVDVCYWYRESYTGLLRWGGNTQRYSNDAPAPAVGVAPAPQLEVRRQHTHSATQMTRQQLRRQQQLRRHQPAANSHQPAAIAREARARAATHPTPHRLAARAALASEPAATSHKPTATSQQRLHHLSVVAC